MFPVNWVVFQFIIVPSVSASDFLPFFMGDFFGKGDGFPIVLEWGRRGKNRLFSLVKKTILFAKFKSCILWRPKQTC